MKILFVIDHFGSGGAQRQMVNLAVGLKSAGVDVEFFIYYPSFNFYRSILEENRIKVTDFHKRSKGFSPGIIPSLRKQLKQGKYDLALSYLDSPSIYLLLGGIGTGTRLVVSDRSSYLGAPGGAYLLKRQLYRIADVIVTNSETQEKWFISRAGFSPAKVVTIYNGYDMADFNDSPAAEPSERNLKLIAVGGIRPVKNIEGLVEGLDLFRKENGWLPEVSWIGMSDDHEYEVMVKSLLLKRGEVRKAWRWLGERRDIPELLANHHALILPSFYEGLPNVVCEALFAGKPVLASNVCDNPLLVRNGTGGFLFDPSSPPSISEAIGKLAGLNLEDYRTMALENRKFAIENLSIGSMVEKYMSLFQNILEGGRKKRRSSQWQTG